MRKDTRKLPIYTGKRLFEEFDEFDRYRYSAFVTNEHQSGEIIALIMVLIIALIIYRSYLQKCKANRKLSEQNEIISIPKAEKKCCSLKFITE
ncbi:MAG: hypothetical protein KJ578_03330 [Bacteroidetes bacterium]|nr:hypothetical protein [Bacteroidota bacterium]